MDVKKGSKTILKGLDGIFGIIAILCIGIFLTVFTSLFWIFLLANIVGESFYLPMTGLILGIITTLGLLYFWLFKFILKK